MEKERKSDQLTLGPDQPYSRSESSYVGGTVPQRPTEAFSLTDLLVVIACLCLIVLIWLPARADTGHKAGILECKNNLRQVGAAIDAYSQDHTNSLPGPIWIGAFYNYQSLNKGNGSLAYYLATYLGMPAPSITNREIEILKCPASVQSQPNLTQSPPLSVPICFLSNSRITNSPGPSPGDIIDRPFGNPVEPVTSPTQITRIRRPSEEWALVDVDQQYLSVLGMVGATYYGYVPSLPVHNNRPGGPGPVILRNSLFFDGSVRSVKSNK